MADPVVILEDHAEESSGGMYPIGQDQLVKEYRWKFGDWQRSVKVLSNESIWKLFKSWVDLSTVVRNS